VVFYNYKMITMQNGLACLLLFILATLSNHAIADPDYLKQLTAQAKQAHLDRDPYWHELLHYHENLLGDSYTSLVDSPRFFNAPDGKTNPEAELLATLQVFFSAEYDKEAEEPVACRFIARYAWLDEKLKFDHAKLPIPQCERFDTWMERINPKGMTLIFPTAYMNNPSSMFGHTLLRIDAIGQTEKTRLLDYSVNFAANTGNDGGMLFAVKGLLGGYPGAFSVAPYYLKVRDYSDLENRDIWEYQLDFTTQETRRMLMHLWELRTTHFDYYFFDENCSYHLLALIQTARENLDLTSGFDLYAIPSDTVKRIVSTKGLVTSITYRPSQFAVLSFRFRNLSDKDFNLVNQLAKGEITPEHPALAAEPVQTRAKLLELSYELLLFRMHKEGNNSPELQNRSQQLLLARSQIDVISPPTKVIPPQYRPDQGHESAQASISAGNSDSNGFVDLQIRAAYQDLLDLDQGFVKGAQIKFFDTVLRISDDHGRLERFTAVDIFSLTPRSRIQNSLSWKFRMGAERIHITQDNQPLAAIIEGGIGFSWDVLGDSVAYALLEPTLEISQQLEDD
jgi:hypothetical protein